MQTRRFDAVIIGAGQGGGPLAGALASAGRRTALIERAHVGGTCVNVGCTPSKTMAASARVGYLAGRARDYGVRTERVSVDLSAVRARKRSVVESFRVGSEHALRRRGVELLRGSARFSGEREIEVIRADDPSSPDFRVVADLVVINTGARPATVQIPGIGDTRLLDSTTMMELGEVPGRLTVIGGGYVGVEFAQMFQRFGSSVTVLQRAPQLLPHEDPDVAECLTQILREDGVEVLLGASVVGGRLVSQAIRLNVQMPDADRVIDASHVLVATGRVPNTEGLQLDTAGVTTTEDGHVDVNERLETSAPGIYAIGDVKPGPAFTHISYDDFRILRTNLLGGGSATTKDRFVPYAVFTDPQLGGVGMTETEARKGHRVRIAKLAAAHVARALETSETRGMLKAVVDGDSDRILGCSMIATEGAELMSTVQIAMMGNLPYTALRDATFAHPTFAEALNNLFATLSPSAPPETGRHAKPGAAQVM